MRLDPFERGAPDDVSEAWEFCLFLIESVSSPNLRVPQLAEIVEENSRSLAEYLLIPNLTTREHTPDQIDLSTPLVRFGAGLPTPITIKIPLVSSIMQAVSGVDLAISLAKEGGLSFIFQSQSIESQAAMVSRVKKHKAGFVTSQSHLSPSSTMGEALELIRATGHSTLPITSDGTSTGKFLGLLTDKDYPPDHVNPAISVMKYAASRREIKVGPSEMDLKQAYERIWSERLSVLPLVNSADQLEFLVFRRDYEEGATKANQVVDHEGRLLVGAGVNTRDFKERIPALLDARVDVLCIDSSDGYSEWVSDTLTYVRKEYGPEVRIGAGNVVDARAFRFLAEAGADFVKVGVGPGSICITRRQKGIGRGQAAAIMDVAKERDRYLADTGIFVPICTDGGITNDYEIMVALALGADFAMMGRYFAGFDESPTEKVMINGAPYKQYWAEGSRRANNWTRYDTGGSKGSLAFEEGVEGYVPYAGKLTQGVSETISKLKSTFVNCGSRSIPELRASAKLVALSPATIQQVGQHSIIEKQNVPAGAP